MFVSNVSTTARLTIVEVANVEPGTTDADLRMYAAGAAGVDPTTSGYYFQWWDADGLFIAPGDDTSGATEVRVTISHE